MTGTVLERSLKMVAQRLYKLRVLRRQALCWVMLLVPAIAFATVLPQLHGIISTPLLVLLTSTCVGLALARWNVASPTALEAARLVEKNRPELNDAVLTAVQADERSRHQGQPSVLNTWVIDEADKLARESNWKSVIPGRQMLGWSALSFLAFCFLVTGVVAAGRWGIGNSAQNALLPTLGYPENSEQIGAAELTVEPGDVEIERGTALTVVARFGKVLPTDAMLQLITESGSGTFTMDSTVDEGVFAARISSVESDATYRVFFGNSAAGLASIDSPDFRNKSEAYNVTTYVRPRLDQVDAFITPPVYTKKEPQLVEDTLRVTAIEGSTVKFSLHLNKPVVVAELQFEDGGVIPLHSVVGEAGMVSVSIEAKDSRKYSVYLEDEQGRTATEEEIISLKVTRNKRPRIKVTFPGRDTNVSPLQEFQIEAEAIDDFVLTGFGVAYTLSNGTSEEISLVDTGDQSNVKSAEKVQMQHMIDMELLQAVPDQLLSYSFYVEDFASDGTSRRTYSDMMFAEVRRFEEIFRESQQQQSEQQKKQQQEQQGSQKTEELMELQRQIMIATWNIRRSLDEGRSREKAEAKAVEDSDVVLQSQQSAIEQLQELKEEAAADPEMLTLAEAVEAHMQKTVEALASFKQQSADSGLSDALAAEQSAIAGLMRMRAREHEIQKGQQQGKGKGKNSASQQQLKQLELDNDRKRYESESEAQQQQEQNSEQGEQLQILNRLKELARRQEMLNERLKQLESELRAAETEEEQAEIERELKRLREEQRDMLRDVDELRETMDQQSAEQQQQNQESREQIEQARDRVQQASRAMDEGKLSEAISEGTRAERDFDELQEKFRNQTANEFSDAMKDLRQQTRDMKERQGEIARELAGESSSPEDGQSNSREAKPSLRSNKDREGLQEKVAQQRDDLERVLEQAKQLVEAAEESEPLLSRRLYDTVRDVREKRPQEALEATEILVSRGLYDQGQQVEQIARKGIDDLAKGIDNAADAVLGSEAESLRRAQEEIEDLTNQLSSEVAQATGQDPKAGQGDRTESQQAMPGQGAEGEGQTPSKQQTDEGQSGGGQNAEAGESPQRIQRAASPQAQEKPQPGGGDQPGRPGEEPAGEQGEGSTGQQPGEKGGADPKSSEQQPGQGQQSGEGQQPGQGQPGGGNSNAGFLMNGGRESNNGGRGTNEGRPLTGDEYRNWSNRMREVEEILDDPELRNQVAQVRDRARSIRADFRRHGKEPQWDLVKSQLLDEMVDLNRRITQELSKLGSDRSMVPIDREPIPEEFDELVRRYYELLGQSRGEDE